jgi:hypothetical protein
MATLGRLLELDLRAAIPEGSYAPLGLRQSRDSEQGHEAAGVGA